MTVPFRTFALFGLALGMLAAGYLFTPAPRASSPLPTQPLAKVVPPAPPKPVTTLVGSRPPVPLVTQPRASHFQTVERTMDLPSTTTPAVTPSSTRPDPKDPTQALAMPVNGDDGQAKRAIEFDGYRNVRSLEKGPDGTWRGRAMRGRTEIAVRVDATGNVSAE